ncbi:trypsin-like serine protease [Micromonospora sp. CPCC 206060]|uniref:trypsin-like serine peptidase n=1 Tax=Micromonospora sp. CPCC 206060 TaxID=3122406 RepID=UPI002FEF873B
MVRKRWAAVVVAAMVVASLVPPVGPAAAAMDPARTVSSDGRTTDVSTDDRGGSAAPWAGATVGGYSAPGISAVFGPDDRVPVTPTTAFPASATVLLTFTGGRCSGFMISERTVATAGHCVHTGAGGTWRTNVVAYPGHNGTTAPYGSCAATRLLAVAGWTSSSNPDYDYGAVQLNCGIGNATGWYSFAATTQSVVGACTVNQGYPVDRPGQWSSKDYIRAEAANTIYFQHDATAGQDGSPVYFQPDPDDWCPTRPPPLCPCPPPCPCQILTVVGILTSGPYGGGPGSSNNIGTRITQSVFNNLMTWR